MAQAVQSKRVTTIQLEGLALLKIIKHCSDHVSQLTAVAGQLFGVQKEDVLEVTNCFPSGKSEADMVNIMQMAHEDNNTIGWYRSALYGKFIFEQTIRTQYLYQKQNSNSICIIYDPTSSVKGRLVVRAFRLYDNFLKFYNEQQHGPSAIAKHKLYSNNILEELDVKIHNSYLVHAFLFELRDNKSLSCEFDRLSHYIEEPLINNLRQLNQSIDSYSNETNTFRQYHSKCLRIKKQKEAYLKKLNEENRILRSRGIRPKEIPDLNKMFPKENEVSRLPSLALISQMTDYTEEIETNTMQGLAKLFITQGLHQDKL